jgi:hypothetical protein
VPADGEQPVAEAAPEAGAEPVPELVLEDTAFGPKELGDFLKKDAGVEKFFNQNPEVKNRIFAMARRDAETRGIRQIAPTLELAKEMQRGHALYSEIDDNFLKADTPEGFKGFMDMWLEQAVITDDSGKPVLDGDGKYKVHPALTSIIENIHSNRNDVLANQMAQSGKIPRDLADSTLKVIDFLSKSADEGIQEAAKLVKEVLAPSSSASGQLPDELKPYSESLQAKEKELNDRIAAQDRTQRDSEKAAHKEALRRADFKAAEVCLAQVNPLLKAAGLTEYEQKAAKAQIGDLVDQKLRDITGYQIARNRLEAGKVDAAREKEISKIVVTYTQEILGDIVRDVIRGATAGKLDRQTATDNRIAEQQRTSRTDPRGTSVNGGPSAPMSAAQLEDAVIKEYKDAHNGESPDRRYITQKVWEKSTAAPARRTA